MRKFCVMMSPSFIKGNSVGTRWNIDVTMVRETKPLLAFAYTLMNYLPNALLPWDSVCTTFDSVEPVKIKVDLPEICNWLTENPGEYTSLFHAFFVLAIAAWPACYRYFQTGLCCFDVLQWKSGTIWMVARLRLKKLCPRMTWVSWNCAVFFAFNMN